MKKFNRFLNDLKWAATGQAAFIVPKWAAVVDYVIDTKTGEYVHVDTGIRKPADTRSREAVNNSFWTLKKI